MMFLH
jgi:ribosome assembly protein RRB1